MYYGSIAIPVVVLAFGISLQGCGEENKEEEEAQATRSWEEVDEDEDYDAVLQQEFDEERELEQKQFSDKCAKNFDAKINDLRGGKSDIQLRLCCDTHTKEVAQNLESNTNLERLQLLGVDDSRVEILVQALKKNTKLESLVLGHNRDFGQRAVNALADLITTTEALTDLSLNFNRLGDEGVKILAGALERNPRLTSLSLRTTMFGVDGARALAEALKKNTVLRVLDLDTNFDIRLAGAMALSDALKTNNVLAELDVSGTLIGDAGAKAFAEALVANTGLLSLDLSSAYIGNQGATALADALKKNKVLRHIGLDFNHIDDAGATALLQALETNSSLTELNIDEETTTQGGEVVDISNKVSAGVAERLHSVMVQKKNNEVQKQEEDSNARGSVRPTGNQTIDSTDMELRKTLDALDEDTKELGHRDPSGASALEVAQHGHSRWLKRSLSGRIST